MQVLKGIASIAVAAAAVVGPPLALVRFVGNPLPDELPAWNQVTDAIAREGVSDATIIGILAVLAWIIWVQIALAVVVEAAAIARGVPAVRLPLLPGVQSLAGYWLAAAMLIVSPASGAPGPHAPLPLLVSTVAEDAGTSALVMPPEASASTSLPPDLAAHDSVAPQAATPATTIHVVQRHDNLWDIAERYLGDPFRWHEIRDLNVGRGQPDGCTPQPGFETIHPGWRLLVPVASTESSHADARTYTVEPGDHLWGIAEDHVERQLGRTAANDEVRPYWHELIEENRDRLVDPSDPSLIRPGQVLALPSESDGADVPSEAVDVPAPVAPTSTSTTAEPAPATSSVTTNTSAVATTSVVTSPNWPTPTTKDAGTDNVDRSPVGMLLGIGGAALSTGVLAAVRRRQRRRSLVAPRGHSVPPLPAELDLLRAEIACRSSSDGSSEVESALVAIASHLAATPSLRSRRPVLVQLSGERVEVLLDQPALPPPAGWQPQASGSVWVCERPAPDGAGPSPAPTLVTVGAESTVEFMLDLEALGLITVDGDAADVQGFARSLLLELEHKASGDSIALAVVGDIDVDESCGVRRGGSWDEIEGDVRAWAQQSRLALDANRLPNPFVARGAGRPIDGVAPLVVICDSLPGSRTLEEVRGLASSGCAVSIVGIGCEPIDAPHIHLQAGELQLDAIGLRCRAQGVARDVAAAVERLVEAADRPAEPSVAFEPPESIDLRDEAYVDPPHDVLVKVLGEVGVVGGHRPLTPKETALFTFVALHPGCSVDRLEEAIWPTPMEARRRQLHNVVSQVRSALGPDHLPASEESRYTVGSRVRTDLDLLSLRANYAATQAPSRAIETLRGALEFVDGPPFAYRHADRGSYMWVDLHNWTITTEAKVVEVAWRLWELCVAEQDFDGAIWAARRGLLAAPGNAELTEALMRAHVASGDRDAAEDVFRAHAKVLDELDQDEPAPTTLELWDEIRSSADAGR